MQNDWAYNEFAHARLWDARCRGTLVHACQILAEQAELSFSRALGSRRKAVSRILRHEDTTAQDLLAGHVRATAGRCRSHPRVLVASDTTVVDFTSHPAAEGMGPISSQPHQRGFLVHSALALTPEGMPLGLLHQDTWVRPPAASEREDKESGKWLDALRGVEKALPPTKEALLIQDREADVYAFFAAPRRQNVELLLRVCQPRRVAVAEGETTATGSLFDAVAEAPIIATRIVLVRARPDREAREAVVSLRCRRVWVLAPRNATDAPAKRVEGWVVRAQEEAPPPGVKEPIDWVLLSTLPVGTAEEACQRVDD